MHGTYRGGRREGRERGREWKRNTLGLDQFIVSDTLV